MMYTDDFIQTVGVFVVFSYVLVPEVQIHGTGNEVC